MPHRRECKYFAAILPLLATEVQILRAATSTSHMMFQLSFLVLSASFTVYTFSQAAICTSSRGLLPTINDCNDIAEAIDLLSRMPHENKMRAWGRGLPTTDDTQMIPKVFWLTGRGPTTCAVHVDVDAYDVWAVDDFRLSDVASAAQEVIAQCLVPKRKLGLAYPAGADGRVHAKVRRLIEKSDLLTLKRLDSTCVSCGKVSISRKKEADVEGCVQIKRTDSPFELDSFNQSNLQRFAMPDDLGTLLIATVNPAKLISVASHPISNVTGNLLLMD